MLRATRWLANALLTTASVLPLASRAATADFDFVLPVPDEVVFRREFSGPFGLPEVNRYERYGDELYRLDYKNPEYAAGNGPAHLRNRTPGALRDGTMWMIFRLRTENYFGSEAANHIAIVLRGGFDRVFGQTGGTQTGRGLALFSSAYGGLMVENFGVDAFALIDMDDARLVLRDGVSYWFGLHVNRDGIAYSIYTEQGELLANGFWADRNAVGGEGYGFAVLCAGSPNANCDFWLDSGLYNLPFEVRFSHIRVGWF